MIWNSFFVLSLFCFLLSARAEEELPIYMHDNRFDVQHAPQWIKNVARSVVAIVPKRFLKLNLKNHEYKILPENYKTQRNLCPHSPFANQIPLANCTGVLVGPDIVLTAGHCITGETECDDYFFVFDYQSNQSAKRKLNSEQIFSCQELIVSRDDGMTGIDYALIKLDRKVSDRMPLKSSPSQSDKSKQSFLFIGHPAGLPQKYDLSAKISFEDSTHYLLEVDAFKGSSGGPLINLYDFSLAGILTKGEPQDYEFDPVKECMKEFRCLGINCDGESILKTHQIIGHQYFGIQF